MIVHRWLNPEFLMLAPLFLPFYILVFTMQQRKFNAFVVAYPQLINTTKKKKIKARTLLALAITASISLSVTAAFQCLKINTLLAVLALSALNIALAAAYSALFTYISTKIRPVPEKIKINVNNFYPPAYYRKKNIRFTLFAIALSLLWIAALRPQSAPKTTEIIREGIQAAILLDLSRSMLATDVVPSRLDAAKMEITKILENMNNDNVALILFTDAPFVQTPMTRDKNAIAAYLRNAHPDIMPSGGTAIAPALWLAFEQFFKKSLSYDDAKTLINTPETVNKTRVIILVTDGEDHDEDAIKIAKIARSLNIKIYPVAMGTETGSQLMTADNTPLLFQEKPVHSKMNFKLLQHIANAADSKAFKYSKPDKVAASLDSELNRLRKMAFDDALVIEGVDLYHALLWPAMIILLFLTIIPVAASVPLTAINATTRTDTQKKS